jgi:hypothetical protein
MDLLVLLSSLTLVACSNGAKGEQRAGEAPAASASEAGPVPVATLKELMDSTVDPAADGVWEAVAVRETKEGTEHHQPRTPEEWAAVRRHAMTLIESMNLVVLPARHVAPAGTKPGLGELTPAEIESGIARNRVVFVSFAKALQSNAQQALEAIDHKDIDGMVKTGGDIDAACEACHVTFWYPNQQ